MLSTFRNANCKIQKVLVLISLILFLLCNISFAQTQEETVNGNNGAPVILGNRTLFYIRAPLGPFSAKQRAYYASEKIENLANDFTVQTERISVENRDTGSDIVADGVIIMTVTDADARAADMSRPELAENHVRTIRSAVNEYREERSLKNIFLGILYTLGATVGLILLLWGINTTTRFMRRMLDKWKGSKIKPIKIQKSEILHDYQIMDFLRWVLNLFRITAILLSIYLYIMIILGFFAITRDLAYQVYNYTLSVISSLWQSFINYLPNLIYIIIVILIIYYALKLLRLIFREIKVGRTRFPGFYKQWAAPTYNIIKFFIIAFTFALIFPYLPGAGSPAVQGMSIFIGVLVSLGSTAAIANLVAGVILTYTKAYEVGDRVRIRFSMGDVEEKNLLVTRLRTIKNEIISVPNAVVLANPIINYSSNVGESGLILHTSVTIGYSVPWEKVHELLISAALSTRNIYDRPPPFVLQTRLNDSYVTYEINAYTDKPTIMQNTYSDLHKNIQNKFNEAGVEIMSPHYSAIRDGNKKAIPENFYPDSYIPPAFRLYNVNSPANDDKTSDSV